MHMKWASVSFMILYTPFIPSDLIFSAFRNVFADILQYDDITVFIFFLFTFYSIEREILASWCSVVMICIKHVAFFCARAYT